MPYEAGGRVVEALPSDVMNGARLIPSYMLRKNVGSK